jgi:hypothetical protein
MVAAANRNSQAGTNSIMTMSQLPLQTQQRLASASLVAAPSSAAVAKGKSSIFFLPPRIT